MVNGTAKILINTLLQYHVVTLSLYIPRFLGLNMIEPPKPLIDSGLAALLFSASNKTAPKVMKNAPIFGRGNRQNKILILAITAMVAKVGIIFETTKTATIIADGGGSVLLTFNPYKAGSPHHCAHPLNQKHKHLLSF